VCGPSVELQTLIHRAAVAGADDDWADCPQDLRGPPAGGAPPPERGPGGGALEAP
jgi:hypothetical protein